VLAATVTTYPPDGVDRAGAAVRQFRAEAKGRLTSGMAMTAGADEVPHGVIAPLVTFYFGPEHVQLPMEEILDWLRGHPLVRLIEIERHRVNVRTT